MTGKLGLLIGLLLAGALVALVIFIRAEQNGQGGNPEGDPDQPGKGVIRNTVIFIGDDLTAGEADTAQSTYPKLIQYYWEQHKSNDLNLRVEAGSEFSTEHVLKQLNRVAGSSTHTVFLALGGRDALNNCPLEDTEKNLREIIRILLSHSCNVILLDTSDWCGNESMAHRIRNVHLLLAEEYKLPLSPNLMEGIRNQPLYLQNGGLQPNPIGQNKIAATILRFLEEKNLLRS